jgi:hypothetical protein
LTAEELDTPEDDTPKEGSQGGAANAKWHAIKRKRKNQNAMREKETSEEGRPSHGTKARAAQPSRHPAKSRKKNVIRNLRF